MKKSRKRCAVNLGRWVSYAAAGAITTMAASNDADAAIVYSGVLNTAISPGHSAQLRTFPGGTVVPFKSFLFELGAFGGNADQEFQSQQGTAPENQARVAGVLVGAYGYASKFAAGVNINALANFLNMGPNGREYLASNAGLGNSQFRTAGTGFLAFEFKLHNAGPELYGWARVTMNGLPSVNYTLVDYAYGTAGQAIQTGQTTTPEPASLALLALGAVGVLVGRKGRKGKAIA